MRTKHQTKGQKLEGNVAGRAIDELGEHRREEHTGLGVGNPDHETLPEDPFRAAPDDDSVQNPSQSAPVTYRPHTKDDQVGGADELDGREDHRGAFHDHSDSKGHGRRLNQLAHLVAHCGDHRRLSAMRQRALMMNKTLGPGTTISANATSEKASK
jgi:hypothetical protein